MILSISQSEATRQFVIEQEIETNKGLFTPQHREEKLLVSDIGPSAVSYTHLTLPTIYSV